MRLPSIPLEIMKKKLSSTIVLESKIIKSNHIRYYMLRFKEQDLPYMMDLLGQMENLRCETTHNSNGFHLSLYLMNENEKISNEVLSSSKVKELRFELKGIGFRVTLGQLSRACGVPGVVVRAVDCWQ